jgi:hypothetical protein
MYGIDDRNIPSASTYIPGNRYPYLFFCRIRMIAQEGIRSHKKAWCAKSALKSMVLYKSLLERVKLISLSQRLNRHQFGTISLDC